MLYLPYKFKFLNGHRAGWVNYKDCSTVSSDSACSVKVWAHEEKIKTLIYQVLKDKNCG